MARSSLELDYIRVEGDPILRRRAAEVTMFDHKLEALAERMLNAMHRSGGVGLAAPQVGVGRRLMVVETPTWQTAVINPVLVEFSDQVEMGAEGCLSVPYERFNVARHHSVVLHGRDLSGRHVEIALEGFDARVAQHEVDHLDGILIRERSQHG